MLSGEELATLLKEAKTYLGITWDDEATEGQLMNYIKQSAARLEAVYGHTLLFVEPVTDVDYLAKDLLLSRVFYSREKALDDFEGNYRGELLYLRNKGKAKTLQDESEVSGDAS